MGQLRIDGEPLERDRAVAGQGGDAADQGHQKDSQSRPGCRDAEDQQDQGREDQIADRRAGLAEDSKGDSGQQAEQGDRLAGTVVGARPGEPVAAGEQQQGRGDGQKTQGLHGEIALEGEDVESRRIVVHDGGQANHEGRTDQDGRGHGRHGEAQQAAGATQVQGRAADPPGQDAGDQDLGEVQHRVEPQEGHGVAPHYIGDEIDRQTRGQDSDGLATMQLEEGGQQDAVGRPHHDRAELLHAPQTDEEAGAEQRHIGPGRGAGLTSCFVAENPPVALHQRHSLPRDRFVIPQKGLIQGSIGIRSCPYRAIRPRPASTDLSRRKQRLRPCECI